MQFEVEETCGAFTRDTNGIGPTCGEEFEPDLEHPDRWPESLYPCAGALQIRDVERKRQALTRKEHA